MGMLVGLGYQAEHHSNGTASVHYSLPEIVSEGTTSMMLNSVIST